MVTEILLNLNLFCYLENKFIHTNTLIAGQYMMKQHCLIVI